MDGREASRSVCGQSDVPRCDKGSGIANRRKSLQGLEHHCRRAALIKLSYGNRISRLGLTLIEAWPG
jgi:hypothetical protein